MVYLRKCIVYFTLALMLATLWALGYARQCEDRLQAAQHAAVSPELRRALAEVDRTPIGD